MASTSALTRASPFRETDWDRKLDSMLEDLEGTGGGSGGGGGGGSRKIQSASHSAFSSGTGGGVGSQLYSKSSSSYRAQQQSSYSSTSLASQMRQQQQQQQSSSSSRHDYGGVPTPFTAAAGGGSGGGGGATNGFPVSKSQSNASLHENADSMLKDLEGSLKASSNYLESHRSVSGPGSRSEYHEYRSYSSGGGGGAGGKDFDLERQVQHMMPQQQMQQQFSSGLQSSNMVSSSQKQQSYSSSYKMSNKSEQQQERPGSRLKQNIDELDTLLYDLNNARKISDGADYTAASSTYTPGNASDDYSYQEGTQGHVKRTAKTYNEQSYQSSPPSARRAQPVQSSYKYSAYSSSSSMHQGGQQQQQQQFESSRALAPSQPLPSPAGTPAGVTYYSKYHSTQSHSSQQQQDQRSPPPPVAARPSPAPAPQAPPKRVDQLLSELSEVDDSIDTRFVEPEPQRHSRKKSPPRPESPVKQQSAGPAVYYPPGEMFASSKPRDAAKPAKKAKEAKPGKIKDGEGKQGAAVVPICLPLCCAAPCVIM